MGIRYGGRKAGTPNKRTLELTERLEQLGEVISDGYVCHVRSQSPLRVRIDGRSGRGVLMPARPAE